MTNVGLWLGWVGFSLLELWFRLIHVIFSTFLFLLMGLAEGLIWLVEFIDSGFLQWVRLRGSSARDWAEYMRDRAGVDEND